MQSGAAQSLRAAKSAISAQIKRSLDDQAQDALHHILDRTLKGQSVSGRKFSSYTPFMEIVKGRKHPVTLRDTYAMMNSLYVRPGSAGTREIVFRDRGRNERIGRYHQTGTRNKDGTIRMRQRRWFGLTLRYSRQAFQKFQRSFEVLTPTTDRRKSFKISLSV